jgi:hypothetical protein
MKKRFFILPLVAILLIFLVSCQASETTTQAPPAETEESLPCTPEQVVITVEATPIPPDEIAAQEIPSSLHATTDGMAYFYSAEHGGLETLSGVPYDELGCKNCHVGEVDGQSDCTTCHITDREVTNAPPQFKCMACHGRQGFEIKAQLPDGSPAMSDVHYAKGMQCVNCHGEAQVHGDGEAYHSFHEMDLAACTDCHETTENPEWAAVTAHDVHGEDTDCAACHVRNVINCVNCHFDTEVNDGKKLAQTKYYNWRFLVKDAQTGKYTTATVMSMVSEGQTFVAVAPFYGHTIGKPDPQTICAECHQNAAVAEYQETGHIVVQKWNEDEGAFSFATGVIPFPPDYQKAMVFDFVTRDGDTWNDTYTNWTYLKTGVDLWQMLFAEPLDEMPTQMDFGTSP